MTTTHPGAPDDARQAPIGATSIKDVVRAIRSRRAFTVTEHLLSTLATILLSTAALASAWSSYQASIWSGKQSSYYSEAGGWRNKASREFTRAGEERMIDIGLFNSWAQAYAAGDDTIAQFMRNRFRAEFTVAFNQWLALRPLRNPDAPRSPFQMKEYRLASIASGLRIDRVADSVFADGQRANDHSDGYVFTAVIFAAVLFFGGMASQIGPIKSRLFLLGLGALMCIVGLVQLAHYPVSR